MICVARKARRVSSKLWHGRKDDEIWASGTPSCQARFGRRRQESLKKASIRDSEKSKYCSSGDRPNPGEPNVGFEKPTFLAVTNYRVLEADN